MQKQLLPVVEEPCCESALTAPLAAEEAIDLAAAFKALSDPIRLRLLSMIAAKAGGEVCVCDLTEPFEVSGPTISHHLKTLRTAGLIDCQRRGTWVYYWIVPARLAQLSKLLDLPAVPA